MAKKNKEEKKKSSQGLPAQKKSKKKMIIWIILFFLFSGVIAGGVTFFLYKKKDGYKPVNSEYFSISEKTEKFIYLKAVLVHQQLKKVDADLILINHEIERVKGIQKEYPDQKKITEKAISKWEKLKKNILKQVKKTIVRLDYIYVQYLVNPETGAVILKQESEKINGALKALLQKIDVETKILKTAIPAKKGFIDKIKGVFK